MPSFDTSVVLNDGSPTPVARTFSPERKVGDEASWVDRSSGLMIGYPRLKVAHVLPNGKKQPLGRIQQRITVPELEVVQAANGQGYTPAPSLAYLNSATTQFIFNERSSEQQRKNMRILQANWLLSAQAVAMIDKWEPAY